MNKKNQQVVDLTTSRVSRQNVLNNRYALENIRSAVGIKCVLFDGEYRILKQDVASFFEISQRGLEKVVARNGEELQGNGYAVFEGNALKEFMLACEESYAGELKFGTKTTALATFSFRAFLNVAMLLTRSEKAKVLRSAILDIVIDTINERVGGSTKFINQRDEANLKGVEYAWLVSGVDNRTHALTNSQYKCSRPRVKSVQLCLKTVRFRLKSVRLMAKPIQGTGGVYLSDNGYIRRIGDKYCGHWEVV